MRHQFGRVKKRRLAPEAFGKKNKTVTKTTVKGEEKRFLLQQGGDTWRKEENIPKEPLNFESNRKTQK